MSDLLTCEEIESLKEEYEGILKVEWHPTVFYLLGAITEAQSVKTKKGLVEWLEKVGTEEYYWKDKLGLCIPIRHWESLKKEVEDE